MSQSGRKAVKPEFHVYDFLAIPLVPIAIYFLATSTLVNDIFWWYTVPSILSFASTLISVMTAKQRRLPTGLKRINIVLLVMTILLLAVIAYVVGVSMLSGDVWDGFGFSNPVLN